MQIVTDVLGFVAGQEHFRWLLLALAANVLVKYAAVLRRGEFRLAFVGDWLHTRLIPLLLGYGAAVLLAAAMREPLVETVAFAALSATYAGYVLSALRELLGIKLPAVLTGNEDD